MPQLSPGEQSRNLQLEGSRAAFVDDNTLFVILKDGTVYPVELIADGKAVSRLSMAEPIAQTTIPSVVKKLPDDHLFVASLVGPSVLLRTAHVEEEIADGDTEMELAPAAVVETQDTMDLDDDDGKLGCVLTTMDVIHHLLRSLWDFDGEGGDCDEWPRKRNICSKQEANCSPLIILRLNSRSRAYLGHDICSGKEWGNEDILFWLIRSDFMSK